MFIKLSIVNVYIFINLSYAMRHHTTAYRYTSIFGCLILFFLTACKLKPADTDASNFQPLLHDTISEVQAITLQTSSFQHKLISNKSYTDKLGSRKISISKT